MEGGYQKIGKIVLPYHKGRGAAMECSSCKVVRLIEHAMELYDWVLEETQKVD